MSGFDRRRGRLPDEEREPPKPGAITAIQPQQRDNARMSIFIDGQFGFGLHADIVLDHRLTTGQELSEQDITALLAEDQVKKAITAALNLISYRPRSAGELRQRLRQKDYPAEAIDRAVARMEELRYVDDESFAERWVESRQEHQPRSERMLRQELRQKGIDAETIDDTIDAAGIDEYGDALTIGAKKLRSLRGLDQQVRDRRLTGLLGRRGYSYDVIRRVIAELTGDETDSDPS